MQKDNRYYAKVTKAEISTRYKMPVRTAGDWANNNKEDDYRGFLADRLKLYIALENETIENIKKLFTKQELMALWGSLKSTIIDFSLVENPQYLIFGFQDYCIYEEMEAAQFGDIEILQKSVIEKLQRLDSWGRYCLFEYLQNSKDLFVMSS